jgi:hypothetical protein
VTRYLHGTVEGTLGGTRAYCTFGARPPSQESESASRARASEREREIRERRERRRVPPHHTRAY